jgi:hypothetical protein
MPDTQVIPRRPGLGRRVLIALRLRRKDEEVIPDELDCQGYCEYCCHCERCR